MSEAAQAYNALLERDAAAAVEQAEWMAAEFVRAGITFEGEPMRSFLRPHFLSHPEWEALRDHGRRLLELAARVARHAFDGEVDRLCDFLGTPERERPWLRVDPGGADVVISRLDAFMGEGGPRFIEINSDAPAGLGYGDRMADVFMRLPLFQAFARERGVTYWSSAPPVAAALVLAWRQPSAPTVAIVDFADVKTRADQRILQEVFAGQGLRSVLADPREMDLRGGRLFAGSEPVDLVYRRALLPELLDKEDEVRPFLRAYTEGAAVFVNSFRCRLSEDKVFFALLTDERFAALMSEEERALVLSCVPWTRRMAERRTQRAGEQVDLLPHVIAHREELVLKPAHGYGGQSVYVGWETPAAEWEQVARQACDEPWVVQERVAIPEEAFPICEGGALRLEPFKVNANPFYVAGAEVGAVARASRSSVINVGAGGGSVPTFVTD